MQNLKWKAIVLLDGNAHPTIDAMTNRTMNYAPGSAKQVLSALANTPDGVIISVDMTWV